MCDWLLGPGICCEHILWTAPLIITISRALVSLWQSRDNPTTPTISRTISHFFQNWKKIFKRDFALTFSPRILHWPSQVFTLYRYTNQKCTKSIITCTLVPKTMILYPSITALDTLCGHRYEWIQTSFHRDIFNTFAALNPWMWGGRLHLGISSNLLNYWNTRYDSNVILRWPSFFWYGK